jgi:hypothetical protein
MKTTFKTYLEESTYLGEDEISPEEAAQIIKERGHEWEKIIGGFRTDSVNWIIYRGMRVRFSPDICIKYPRTSRRPLTTDKKVHEFTDDYFKHKFGIKFRSESIFVSRSKPLAVTYGDPYVIFPLDRVNFAWSPNVEDFTYSAHEFSERFKDRESISSSEIADFEKFMDSLDYKCNDDSLRNEYVKFSNLKQYEVMIQCDEYLAIRAEALPKVLNLLD